jgi:hypothetical protein
MEEDALKASMHPAPQVDALPQLIEPSHLYRHHPDNRGGELGLLLTLPSTYHCANSRGAMGAMVNRLLRSGSLTN